MPSQTPGVTELSPIADAYGLGLSEGELAEFVPHVSEVLRSWDLVDELYERERPDAVTRTWAEPEHNPFGAWYVTCDITESTDRKSVV